MNAKDISKAKDPDLRAALDALRRASRMARKTAIQTGTDLIVVKDGKLRRITARELLEESGKGQISSDFSTYVREQDTPSVDQP